MDEEEASSTDASVMVSWRGNQDSWRSTLQRPLKPKEVKLSLEALGLHRGGGERDEKFNTSPLPMLVAHHDPLTAALSGDDTFDMNKLKCVSLLWGGHLFCGESHH